MTARKGVPRPPVRGIFGGERIKDEVYRQMFRLEECRPAPKWGSLWHCCAHGWPLTQNLQATRNEIG